MKKMKISFYAVIIAVSIYYTLESPKFGLWQGYGPGPGLLPLILGIAMLILGGIQFLSKDGIKSKEEESFLQKTEAVRVSAFAVLILLAIILMNTVGFLFVTILFSFIVLRFLECYSTKKSIVISILVPFALWVLFFFVFRLDLPKGILSLIL